MKFTKEDVFKALRLGHSQGNAYGSLFNPRTVKKLPKVQAWLDISWQGMALTVT
jgi:hypothetical protein